MHICNSGHHQINRLEFDINKHIGVRCVEKTGRKRQKGKKSWDRHSSNISHAEEHRGTGGTDMSQ